jgi:hypothetical protein
MKKLSLQELRSVIKTVVKEAGEREFPSMDAPDEEDWVKEYPDDAGPEDDPAYAADIEEMFGDGTVDELVGTAGYDDAAGDLDAIDALFYFNRNESFGTITAQDKRTGREFSFDEKTGLWEDVS